MKTIWLGALALLLSNSALAGPAVSGGGTPFTYSGDLIRTIFESPQVWQKVFGSVEKLDRISQDGKSATYRITTTESRAVKNERGEITGWSPEACEAQVTVTNTSADVFIPKLEVAQVDYSACPSVSP